MCKACHVLHVLHAVSVLQQKHVWVNALLLCEPKSAALHVQVVAVRAFQGQATESNTQQQRLHLIKALELGKQCLCVCVLLVCHMACSVSHC